MGNDIVIDFIEQSMHPLTEVIMYVRNIFLSFDQIEECIKWKSPTFMYKGNIASINPRTKKCVSIMFHTGASIPGDFPHLEGSGNTTKYLNIENLEEAKAIEEELRAILKSWIIIKENEK